MFELITFKGARAPFTLLHFSRRTEGEADNLVIYESARRVCGNQGSLAYARLDRRVVRQASLYTHDFLWKTYSLGGHRDEALVLRLGNEGCLGDLVSQDSPPRFGWQNPTGGERGRPPSEALRDMRSIKRLRAWGPLEDAWFTPLPERVKREPHPQTFTGRRLVIGMGVVDHFGLHARIVTEPLAFQHSMLGFPLAHRPGWQAEVALGVLLSSVGRYWLAMVSGGWGVWRDQVRKAQLLKIAAAPDSCARSACSSHRLRSQSATPSRADREWACGTVGDARFIIPQLRVVAQDARRGDGRPL